VDKVIYIGDGVWDIGAAQKLGYGFVGLAQIQSTEGLYG
jgi:phosphoglycolate phosphatase-like HAD superfamily hydrolase